QHADGREPGSGEPRLRQRRGLLVDGVRHQDRPRRKLRDPLGRGVGHRTCIDYDMVIAARQSLERDREPLRGEHLAVDRRPPRRNDVDARGAVTGDDMPNEAAPWIRSLIPGAAGSAAITDRPGRPSARSMSTTFALSQSARAMVMATGALSRSGVTPRTAIR